MKSVLTNSISDEFRLMNYLFMKCLLPTVLDPTTFYVWNRTIFSHLTGVEVAPLVTCHLQLGPYNVNILLLYKVYIIIIIFVYKI